MIQPKASDSLESINPDKMSPRWKSAFKALMVSGVVDKALAESEAESVEHRRELNALLGRIRLTYPTEQLAFEAAADKAAKELQTAEQRYVMAKEAMRAAQAAANGVEMRYRNACAEIDAELMESADPRLGGFIFQLEQLLRNDLVAAPFYKFDREKNMMGGVNTVLRSNHEEVEKTAGVLRGAAARAAKLQRAALTYVEVGAALGELCADIAPALAKLELNPPSLSAACAEVGAPGRWNGTSEWVFDSAIQRDRSDRRAHMEELRARAARNSSEPVPPPLDSPKAAQRRRTAH